MHFNYGGYCVLRPFWSQTFADSQAVPAAQSACKAVVPILQTSKEEAACQQRTGTKLSSRMQKTPHSRPPRHRCASRKSGPRRLAGWAAVPGEAVPSEARRRERGRGNRPRSRFARSNRKCKSRSSCRRIAVAEPRFPAKSEH